MQSGGLAVREKKTAFPWALAMSSHGGTLRFRWNLRKVCVQSWTSKFSFSCEHVCKVSLLKARISILSRLLQCFLKVLQNRSEKLKNAFPKTRNAILLGVFSDFQTSHTIFTIKLQTFEVQDSELHFARQKQCFGAKLCARLLKKRSPSPKVVPNRSQKAKKLQKTKNIEKRQGKIGGDHPAQSRVYYHSEVRTPIATAMFGEKL